MDALDIVALLRAHGVPLIADDVAATPFNVDLTPHADLVATSLSKYLVGTADAMGGAVICNPRSPYHAELKAHLATRHEELLGGDDAAVLDSRLAGFAGSDVSPTVMRGLRERSSVSAREIFERARAGGPEGLARLAEAIEIVTGQ